MTSRKRPAAPAAAPRSPWDGRLALKFWAPAFVLMAAVILAGGIYLAFNRTADAETTTLYRADGTLRQRVHWHADFALYIRGQQFDFGQPQFQSTTEKPLSETAHIHEGAVPERSQVVHVHFESTTWDEFLRSLNIRLADPTVFATPATTTLTLPSGEVLRVTPTERFWFFINGVKVDGIAGQDIGDLDRVLVVFGTETEAQARAYFPGMSDQACILSEVCTDRINPNEPPEACSKSSSTCN